MFEFSGRLKMISLILILIGVVSVSFSFLGNSADHGDEHAHHEATHHEEIPAADDRSYHRGASRAIAANSHRYGHDAHHDEEHAHHMMENRPWASLLTNTFFALAIGLGALFFLAIQYAAQAGWTVVLLRILESMASFIWVPAVVLLVIIGTGIAHIGGNHVYHWMAEGIMDPNSDNYDALIAGKEGFLNAPFFLIRSVVYILGWVGVAALLRKMSLKFEQAGIDYERNWAKMRNWSAGFLVFFAVTSSTSAWDWIMSIDTHWFSTLFGWYVFASMFVSALTALLMVTLYLKSKGYLREVNENHIHDVAKFMFAFSIFWTYLWFSQYMLIWYSNIPEEVTYYMIRFQEYRGLFMFMLALNFLFPLLVLMSRDSKRNRGFAFTAGIAILIGHWLDIYIMIHPGSVGTDWSLGWTHFGTLLGFVGLFIFVVFGKLAKAPLVPVNHPMYHESKHFQL